MTEGTRESDHEQQLESINSPGVPQEVDQKQEVGGNPIDMASGDRSSSRQFADEIRQLELEGTRLLAATSNLQETLGLSNINTLGSIGTMDYTTTSVNTSLRALADISAEQKAIDEMRHQLDAQTREAERLARGLKNDVGFKYSSSQSLLDRLDIPTVRSSTSSYDHSIRDSVVGSRDELQYLTRSQLERELLESRQQLSILRNQMTESISISEKQKLHFRTTIEELKSKLQEAVIGKDTLLDAKKRETAGQEAMIYKLQQTIDHLEQSNRRQEEMILDLTRKQESVQREHYVLDMSLNQLRSLLAEQEQRRGRAFYEGELVSSQNSTMLIRSVEKCIQELVTELDMKSNTIMQLRHEIDDMKIINEEKLRLMTLEHQERMSELQSAHEKQLEMASEKSEAAKHQVAALQQQLQTIQHQMEDRLRLKEQHVADLMERLRSVQDEFEVERQRWKEKRAALEMACDESQKELSLIKKEREEDIRRTAVLESRYTDMQKAILKLEKDSEMVSNQKVALLEQERNYKQKEQELLNKLSQKEEMIQDLKKALDSVKQECNNQMQQTVSNIENEGKMKAAEESRSLSTQLSAVSEKCYKLSVDLEFAKSQYDNLKEKYDDLKVEYTKIKEQLQSAHINKAHQNELCQAHTAELERLAQDRDKYIQMIEDKNKEISDLKATREKLTIQLEEREKNYLALQTQHEKLSENITVSSRGHKELQDERDALLKRINEKIIETEELRHARDNLSEKLREKESELAELKRTNTKINDELKEIRLKLEQVSKEKESLVEELTKSRYDVSCLREDVSTLQRQLEEKQGSMGKEINRLTRRLKAAEHELKIASKTMKTQEHVDGKAIKVADKMQKEVTVKRGQIDSLKSHITWLEENIETAEKEKKVMRDEIDKLSKRIKKSSEQNDRLRAELQEYIRKNNCLRDKLNKMEAALEKAAVKHAASQAKVEQYEQDLARLKLKHQLELKEIERGHRAMATSEKLSSKRHSMLRPKEHVLDESQKTPQSTIADKAIQEDLKALIVEMKHILSTQSLQRQNVYQPESSSDYHLRYTESAPQVAAHTLDTMPTRHDEDKRIAEELLAKYNNLYASTEYEVPYPVKTYSDITSKHQTPSELFVCKQDDDTEFNNLIEDTQDSEGYLEPTKHLSKPLVSLSEGLVTDKQTQELCKRLEKKIDNLSKLGGHLEKENKEMTRMIKDQDRKIKKVKNQLVP